MVPKETLRQARAQFEFLARECVRRGDVATQAMCELGAHSIDLALVGETHPAVGGRGAQYSRTDPSTGRLTGSWTRNRSVFRFERFLRFCRASSLTTGLIVTSL